MRMRSAAAGAWCYVVSAAPEPFCRAASLRKFTREFELTVRQKFVALCLLQDTRWAEQWPNCARCACCSGCSRRAHRLLAVSCASHLLRRHWGTPRLQMSLRTKAGTATSTTSRCQVHPPLSPD